MTRVRHFLALALAALPGAAATTWQTLSPGIEYTRIHIDSALDSSAVHAFRVDPQRYTFDIALAKDFGQSTTSVRELAERRGAVLAINGGFFDHTGAPLGLRVSRGVVKHPVKAVSWWSVFAVDHGKPLMSTAAQFTPTATTQMAVQSGPRLVVNGAIPPLKDGDAARSALCITAAQQVIVVGTENLEMSTEGFAALLRKSERLNGLGCVHAQNLDGGRSTQLFARLGKFQLHVPNLSTVSDAVVVVPKTAR